MGALTPILIPQLAKKFKKRRKTDMDKYKKICLYFRVQYLSLPHLMWDSLVPPGPTRRRQSRAKAQHKYQYKIIGNSWESKKKRQLGHWIKKKLRKERRKNSYKHLIPWQKCEKTGIFRSLVIWSTSRPLAAQRPEYKHKQIRQLLHWFTCTPLPLYFFSFFVFSFFF